MSARTRLWLMFGAGVAFAAALNNARWAIWPISGGPYLGHGGPQLFGWLGGPGAR